MTCPICGREPARPSELCGRHNLAKKSLTTSYEKWRLAYGNMDWREYLSKIEKLEDSGEWVKEVARYLAIKQG